jgi:hypothetical protein
VSNLDQFNDKKILLVCAETFSWPMHYVAERVRSKCAEISAIYIQPGETYFDEPDYRLFKELNKDINIYEMSAVVDLYLKSHKDAKRKIDWNYINKIESNYTKYSSLNEQLLSEMMLITYFHDANYYEQPNYYKILLYVQLYYKHIEEIFEKNRPDFILDCDVDFFGRTVLLEVASVYNIPYITLDYARVDSFALPTLSLSKELNKDIKSSFDIYSKDESITADLQIKKFYDKTKKDIGGIPSLYQKSQLSRQFSAYNLIKQVVRKTFLIPRKIKLKQLRLNILQGVSSPICSNIIKRYKFMYMYFIRRFYLEYSNFFDSIDLTKINYIFAPMHVLPESSTTILAPYYINEIFVIESLSKAVRADQFIVVKEHWSMIGYRPISYYKRLKQIPNVILIDPTSYSNPKDYINNADLVVTISGTAALEAAALGVNSLIFSDVIHGLLSSVKKISVNQHLRDIIKKHMQYKMNDIEFYAYLKILLNWGAEVNIKKLLSPPALTDKNEVSLEVDALLLIFANGLELHSKNN